MTKSQLVDSVQTRTAKHPRTGEPMQIAPARVPRLSPVPGLEQAVGP
ncbi:MAG: HU family DNA-binding protein [Actinobacteria bacterium]|nr:HU family DNA-binding protein [Actinomycetota bacterium]